MAPDIETFLAEWAQDDHPPTPQTLSAWRRLLSDPSIPASSVAKEAVSHWAQRRVANPDPISIWRLMWDSVQKFTDHNDRILDFLDELRKLPDCDGAFQGLPGLSEDMTEFIFDYLDHAWSPSVRDAERIGWKNVNIFTVKMHIRGIHTNGSGQLCRGSWVVRKTLEKAPWETFHHADIEDYIESWDSDSDDEEYCKRRDCELETIDIRTLDGWVPAAAQWFIYLGKEMYEHEGTPPGTWSTFYRPTLWTGKDGWSTERWAFWKERWAWIGGVTALNRSTRKLAKQMVALMTSIEDAE